MRVSAFGWVLRNSGVLLLPLLCLYAANRFHMAMASLGLYPALAMYMVPILSASSSSFLDFGSASPRVPRVPYPAAILARSVWLDPRFFVIWSRMSPPRAIPDA